MKKWLKYAVALCVGAGFIAVYIIGYKTASAWESDVVVMDFGDTDEVALKDNGIIKNGATYILETYNETSGIEETETKKVPVLFIGYTREKLLDFISENAEYFAGRNEVVNNVSLLSFSGDKIVVRREIEEVKEQPTYSFEASENMPKYFIFIIDKSVVVYKSDLTTVYMETGIKEEELSDETAGVLRNGLPVYSISELYRLLESYTS